MKHKYRNMFKTFAIISFIALCIVRELSVQHSGNPPLRQFADPNVLVFVPQHNPDETTISRESYGTLEAGRIESRIKRTLVIHSYGVKP